MIDSKTITPEEEKRLLDEWFASVTFIDEEYQDGEIPGLAEEDDDEGRSVLPFVEPRASNEKRAARLSTVERRIIKDSDQCPQCVSNNDPRKVPVHPNCHCNVITDDVETGVADPESRLLDRLTEDVIEIVMADGADVPGAVQLNSDTIAAFDAENVRWADLARWLEQMQPYLDNVNNYISIVVDEDTDEAAAEIEEALAIIAEDTGQISEQLLENKKLWFSIAQVFV